VQNNSSSSDPHQFGYLDFEVEVGLGSGRDYPVTVLHSPAGEARDLLHFPFDELMLQNHLKDLQLALLRSGGAYRQLLSTEQQAVQSFGKALFDSLLHGEVRSRYDVSQTRAAQSGQGLRMKLRILPPELSVLPWEFLFDSRQSEYICLSTNTPVIRYVEVPQPLQPLSIKLPLRILGMTSSPQGLIQLDTKREMQRLVEATKELQSHGLIDLTWIHGQTWRDLQRQMRSGPWHIFHFIGHGGFDRGSDEGIIALADEDGQMSLLHATELGRLLADHRTLRLVFLNACEGARGSSIDIFSSTASILVRRGIPAVLAMQYEITDRAAIEFSRAFYESLAEGYPVDASVAEARKSVSLAIANTLEWGTPVLYMRSPDGILFRLQTGAQLKHVKKDNLNPSPIESDESTASTTTTSPAESAIPIHTDLYPLQTNGQQSVGWIQKVGKWPLLIFLLLALAALSLWALRVAIPDNSPPIVTSPVNSEKTLPMILSPTTSDMLAAAPTTPPAPKPTLTERPEPTSTSLPPEPTLTKRPAPTNTPLPPTALPSSSVEGFEGYDTGFLNNTFQVNNLGGSNPASIRIVGPPHTADDGQALALEFQIKHPAPDDYVGFERYLGTAQNWSGYTHLCFWIDNQSTASGIVIQFREKSDEGWKYRSALANISTGNHCLPLSQPTFTLAEWSQPRNGQIDLGEIVYYGIYINGPVGAQGTIYLDNIRLVSQ
jgi:hypothetical protein